MVLRAWPPPKVYDISNFRDGVVRCDCEVVPNCIVRSSVPLAGNVDIEIGYCTAVGKEQYY